MGIKREVAIAIASSFSILVCLSLAACDSRPDKPETVQVSGKLLLPTGAPVTGGTMVLRPENGAFGAIAKIQPDGSFTLEDAGKPGIVPGKYQVFVRFSDNDPVALQKAVHQRYQESTDDGDSDVIIDIPQDNDYLEIRLNR